MAIDIQTLKNSGILDYPFFVRAQEQGSVVTITGYNGSVSNSMEDITAQSAPNNTYLSVSTDSGATLDVQTTAAGDAVAGTGAQVVRVHYIDTDWDEAYEDVDTAGVGSESTTGGDILRVQRMEVVQTGTGGTNAGVIYLRENGGTTSRYCVIPAGGNISKAGFMYIPRNHTLFITDVILQAYYSSAQLVSLYLYYEQLYGTDEYTEAFFPLHSEPVNTPFGRHIKFQTPFVIGERCRVRLRGVGNATSDIDAAAIGILVATG